MAFQPSDATMFENLEQDYEEESDGADEELDRRETVSNIVSTSYETVDDGVDSAPRDRANTRSDRWAATAAHVRKRIESTKRHTKAIRKKYNDIVTKREKDPRRPGQGGQQLAMYGAPLQVAVNRSVLNQGVQLPTVVRHCIDHLEEFGLDHQGIYRLSGQKSKVEAIKAAYDNGDEIDLMDYTPDEVAGALKLYLRELPSSVLEPITDEVDQLITNTDLDVPTRCQQVHEMLEAQLPPCNYALVSWLCIHLSHVIAKADINKMKLANVVIVFAPTVGMSQPTLNFFFTYPNEVFQGVELRHYVVPSLDDTQLFSQKDLDAMDPSELTWQLIKTEDLLTQLHKDLHTLTESEKESKSDMIWNYQRQVTNIKRLLRTKAKTMMKHVSTVGMEDHYSSATTEEHPAEDWQSLQTIVLETLTLEIEKLETMETSLREKITQEKEWTDMVKSQIAELHRPPSAEKPTTDEDISTYTQLSSEVEQWETANEQLISDLASELEQTARLEARISVLRKHDADSLNVPVPT